MEEKSKEVREAAEGYALHHWAEWTALPILLLFLLWVIPGGIAIADRVVSLVGLPEGSAEARRWTLIVWGALALLSMVAFVGWVVPRYQRWAMVKKGVKPEEPAFSCLPYLLMGPGIIIQRLYGDLVVPRLPDSLYPLAWALFFDVVAGSYMLGTWIRRRRNKLWRYSPPAVIVLGLFNLYAIAVALGLPQPSASAPRCMGMSYQAIVPWAGALIAFVVIGWFHSRRELRRLQRLLSEEGKRDE